MNSSFIKNTSMLYLLNIAKIIFPLITLPYLTRVLSVEVFGVVAYVKAIMQYMQLFIDFGFGLSGTKDIVLTRNNYNSLYYEVGNILLAKILLVIIGFICVLLISSIDRITNNYFLYTLLSYCVVALSIFIFDFLFQGLECMEYITIRFIVMKGAAAFFTLFVVKSDGDLLWIPALEIFSSIFASIIIFIQLKKMNIRIKCSGLRVAAKKILQSSVYFLNDISTTAFMALNTIILGIYSDTTNVAYWSICLQLVTGANSLYSPIGNALYPRMIRTKDIRIVLKILKYCVPLICIGIAVGYYYAELALSIIAGEQYINAAPLLKVLVFILFFSFFTMIFGWPMLGAIGKAKETTMTTIITAILQVLGIILLISFNSLTLISMAILRIGTEFIDSTMRLILCWKYRNSFVK